MGFTKEQRARSSRLTGVRLNVREQKETAGEMAVGESGEGGGGGVGCLRVTVHAVGFVSVSGS